MSDAAIVSIVTGIVTILTLWLKLKYSTASVEEKVDANTEITQRSAAEAKHTAKVAADRATEAKAVAHDIKESLNEKLNGGIDEAVRSAVNPVKVMLEAHVQKDSDDFAEIKDKVEELRQYASNRNHDILNALQVHTNMLGAVLKKLGVELKNGG